MSQIWVDLTDLKSWKGHFSGIQRVVYMYAKYYHEHGARLFVYDAKKSEFTEVFGVLDAGVSGFLPIRLKIRNLYRQHIPDPLRNVITPVARKTQHIVYTSIGRVKQGVRKANGYHGSKAPFAVGDKVILFGAGWESKDISLALAEQKKQNNVKLIHLIHDILPISQPHLFDTELVNRFQKYFAAIIPLCDGIISVSEATMKDVYEYASYNDISLTSNQVIVRSGEDSYEGVRSKKPKGLLKPKEKYILSVGTIEVRKNHQLLYNSYKLALQEGVELPRLLIVGRRGWLAEDFIHLLTYDRSVKDKISLCTNVSDEELKWLYENCMFTVYPSICEGWGLTISDSIGKGKLCLTGNVSSMPEVAGDLADYISPYDTRRCLEKIAHYYRDGEALKKKEKALSNYRPTTWSEAFQHVRNFVEEI